VRSRDHLLGAVLWYLTRRAIVRALETNVDRAVEVVTRLLGSSGRPAGGRGSAGQQAQSES
jgi:hypothetical protein